jgi:hypothetical protein
MLGYISGAPLLLCSRTNGPQPACAWSIVLLTHAPTEMNRAGHQSCIALQTRVALLLLRPLHGWRELAVPGCTAALSHLLHQVLRIRPPRAVAQHLLPNLPRHVCHLCLREGCDLPASGSCLPPPSPRRPPTSPPPPHTVPLLPCGSACSRCTAAPPVPRMTSLHTVVLYAAHLLIVVLHSFSFSCCRSRVCFGLAESLPRTLDPRAFLATSRLAYTVRAKPPPDTPHMGPCCPRTSPHQTAVPKLHLHAPPVPNPLQRCLEVCPRLRRLGPHCPAPARQLCPRISAGPLPRARLHQLLLRPRSAPALPVSRSCAAARGRL